MRAQSQEHHTIDHLEERGMERGNARQSSLTGQEKAIVNLTNIWNCFKGSVGEASERCIWAF